PRDAGDANVHADAGPDAALTCLAFYAQVEALKAKAQQCCELCAVVQCTMTASDGCCTITVNDATLGAELSKLVQEYSARCPMPCTDILCPPAPSGTCGPGGRCR